MQGDIEGKARERRVMPFEQPWYDDQMSGTGYGNKLSETLNNPKNNRLDEKMHGPPFR
jgi:hypothetical protein